MRILLSAKTSELLRKVSEQEDADVDHIVQMWCIIALPLEPDHAQGC
jgi:hypothetical protein